MNRLFLKGEAIKLRSQGKTYSEIKKELGEGVPKGYFGKIKLLNIANGEKGRAAALVEVPKFN